jgi:hypothetical protein
MKLVVRITPKTLKYGAFRYDEGGPLPQIIDPEKSEETKDGGAPSLKKNQQRILRLCLQERKRTCLLR